MFDPTYLHFGTSSSLAVDLLDSFVDGQLVVTVLCEAMAAAVDSRRDCSGIRYAHEEERDVS